MVKSCSTGWTKPRSDGQSSSMHRPRTATTTRMPPTWPRLIPIAFASSVRSTCKRPTPPSGLHIGWHSVRWPASGSLRRGCCSPKIPVLACRSADISGLGQGARVRHPGVHSDPVQRLPMLRTLLERFPDVTVILDHFAQPPVDDGPPYAAARDFFALSAYPNLYLKLTESNMRTMLQNRSTIQTFMEATISAFGADRIAWGSNFPQSPARSSNSATSRCRSWHSYRRRKRRRSSPAPR